MSTLTWLLRQGLGPKASADWRRAWCGSRGRARRTNRWVQGKELRRGAWVSSCVPPPVDGSGAEELPCTPPLGWVGPRGYAENILAPGYYDVEPRPRPRADVRGPVVVTGGYRIGTAGTGTGWHGVPNVVHSYLKGWHAVDQRVMDRVRDGIPGP